MKITRYLDPDQGQGGTTDLEKAVFGNFGAVPKPGDEGGTGAAGAGTTPPSTPEETAAQQATLETLLNKDTATLTAEEKTTLESLKTKFNVEEVNEDGTPLTPEQKAAKLVTDKKLTDILAKPEAQRTLEEIKFVEENTQKPVNVYEEVDQLTGIPVTVEYGNVAPNSAEGIAKREEAIRIQAAQEYDAQLKAEVPLAYQFMLHLKNGGNAQDFMQTDSENFQEIVLIKQDVTAQENVYRKALSLKGNTPDQVEALVTYAKDKGKLFEESKKELEQLQRKQAVEEQKREQGVKQQELKEKALVNSFNTEFESALLKGIQGVVIPKADHKAFGDFVRDNTYIRDGRLLYIKELDPKNLGEELAANYFKFKKANLNDLVGRKAASLNAEQLKARIKYKITPRTSNEGVPKNTPMSQV
jgi:hypothetical protein